jgi:aspartyl/asparaginyl beta-hydroxylase (cupin superfamily)
MIDLGVSVRLPIQFDVAKLNRDLERAETFSFANHPLRYHDGRWTAINLIYPGAETEYKHEGDLGYGVGSPESTEVLKHCPYFAEILGEFPGTIRMARLSALAPNGRILRHYDPVESIDFDHVRVHIPIRSNPREVKFHLGFVRRWWRSGELWYGDFTFPHSVHNRASYTRVNLIIDVERDSKVEALFPSKYFTPSSIQRRARLRKEAQSLSWRIGQLQHLVGSKHARV